MQFNWRIIGLSLLLLVGLTATYVTRGNRWDPRVGMTSEPCTAEGKPVSQNPEGDWAQRCRYRADNLRLRAIGSRPQVVFIGDSLTEQWSSYAPSLFDDARVNRGLISQTSGHLLLRFRQDVVELRPRAVHILIGINDAAGNAGPNSPDMYSAAMRSMVEIAEANGITVILGTIPPPYSYEPLASFEPGQWVPEINRWLRQFAAERNLIVADYAKATVSPEGKFLMERYRDGMHPNKKGYAAMQPILDAALAEAEAKSVS